MFALVLSMLVGLEALYIMVLEMFMSAEKQAAVFGIDKKVLNIKEVRALLANQGIYNGALGVLILVVGIFFMANAGKIFLSLLMVYIVIVALYGALTVNKKIALVQGLPALLALLALIFS